MKLILICINIMSLAGSRLNSNTYKLCFWIMSYLLHDPALLVAIQAEIELAFSNEKAEMAYLLDSCPRLNALFDEVLRMTNSSSSVRSVALETVVGGSTFRAGMKVIIPYRQLHFDEAVFGQDAHTLNAQRFLKHRNLNRHPSYRPFGGGTTYCPGRFIARQEVVGFVAFVLKRFDVKLVGRSGKKGDEQRLPLLEERKPCLGVMGPAEKEDLIVEDLQRNVEKK